MNFATGFNRVVWPHAALSAVLVVSIQLVAYILGVDAMVSPWLSLCVSLAFPLGMSLALVALRRDEGGVLPFRRGFLHAWGVAAAMQAVQTAYQLLLFHAIAPGCVEPVVQATLDSLDERLGAFTSAIPDSVAFRNQMEISLRDGFSVAGLLLSGLRYALFAAAGAVVVALVFRRKPVSEFH
jgi:hypothetical protein